MSQEIAILFLCVGLICLTWCDLDLTFDLAVVTLNFKILSGLYLGKFRKLIFDRDIAWGVGVQHHGMTLI